MTIRILTVLALLALAVTAAAVDYPVSDWTLPTSDGDEISLHEALDDGPVLVSFWALWCGPCLKELPHLEGFAAEYGDRLTVLAVNVDSPRSVHKVPSFVSAKGYENIHVLLDTAGDVQRKMQTGGTMPFLALFDRHGREVYRHTGYREGDEIGLREEIEAMLAAGAPAAAVSGGGGTMRVSDQFEYSYSTESDKEIAENWLDAVYSEGQLQLGVMINSQQPAEEGTRRNEVRHRFVEYGDDQLRVRAGHFYGMFGRGLLFAAYEDRIIRTDTVLDGLWVQGRRGRWRGAAFTGAPSALDLDVRGTDHALAITEDLSFGVSALTWQAPTTPIRDGSLLRDWAASARLEQSLPHGDLYAEYATRTHYVSDGAGDWLDRDGHAFYAGLNVHGGDFGLSLEAKDYEDFTILDAADSHRPLNNVPTLTREHLFTLLNRHPYLQDADDAVGYQAELAWSGRRGWSALANTSSTETQDGEQIYEEWYLQVEQDEIMGVHVRLGYDAKESDGLELGTVVGEFTWLASPTSSWVLKAEQQHVTDPGNEFGSLGKYDQQFVSLEFSTAPHWSFTAMCEFNNKFEAQRDFLEKEGPFPAAQVSYVTEAGDLISLWAGQRLGGYLCAGGVCKWEPPFQGVEVFGTIRY